MSKGERRKIFCSVMFHVIAIVCMLWSVYVLVRRTAEEIRLGKNGQYAPPLPSSSTHVSLYHTPGVFAVLQRLFLAGGSLRYQHKLKALIFFSKFKVAFLHDLKQQFYTKVQVSEILSCWHASFAVVPQTSIADSILNLKQDE